MLPPGGGVYLRCLSSTGRRPGSTGDNTVRADCQSCGHQAWDPVYFMPPYFCPPRPEIDHLDDVRAAQGGQTVKVARVGGNMWKRTLLESLQKKLVPELKVWCSTEGKLSSFHFSKIDGREVGLFLVPALRNKY